MKISMKRVVLFFLGVVVSTVMMANHPAAYMQKGAALIAKGKYNEAIRQFDSVIEKWCEYGAAYDYRCWCRMKTGNTDGAVADIVRALRTGEEREKTAELFDILSSQDPAGLVEELRRECAVNPLRRNLFYWLGLALQAVGEAEEAAEAFSESTKEYSGHRIRALIFSDSFFRSNDPKEFGRWVSSQITYPEIAKANRLSGSVTCSFFVDENGNTADVRIVSNVHYDFDSQIADVVAKSPKWTPATADGKAVRSFHVFTMNYLLD